MRRTILYISLSLLTFSIGFLAASPPEQLTVALPVALIIFILIKGVTSYKFTPHRLKVALLTLLIWTPFALITLYAAIPGPATCEVGLPEEENRAARDSVARQLTFKYVSMARVMTVDRGCVDMEIYESSDGIQVYTSTDDYNLAEKASAGLQLVLRPDMEIIDRETLFDTRGRRIGERIVGVRRYGEKAAGFIYRTEGNRLSYIGSSSLSRALEFENGREFTLNDGF